MPFVKIDMLAGRSEEVKAELARRITDVLVEVSGGTRENCIIVFADVPAHDWAIGGDLVSSPKFAAIKKAYQERVAAKGGA